MSAPAKKHPMDYRTRELLLSKRERALFAMDGLAQLSASFKEQIDRLKWQIQSGKPIDPAEVDRFGKHLKHEASTTLNALAQLHSALSVAYPKSKILWAQEDAPWEQQNEKQPVTVGLNDAQRTGQEAHCGASPQANGSPSG